MDYPSHGRITLADKWLYYKGHLVFLVN